MTVSAPVASFIAEQRELLCRLERFVGTPEYRRLLVAATPMAKGDMEPWLAEWLIQPAVVLNKLPIDLVGQPGGVERAEQHLIWIATFMDD